jgi:two-component system sensor histidine kinase BaeS
LRIEIYRTKYDEWLQQSPWLILAAGALLALSLVAAAMTILIRPSFDELATVVGALAVTSVLSLTAGYLLYRKGWTRSPSISFTLVLTYAWAAMLTLFNVWVLARLMFVSGHDLTLAGILLVFAAIIATAFGISVTAGVTDSLRQLAATATRLADGELGARAESQIV